MSFSSVAVYSFTGIAPARRRRRPSRSPAWPHLFHRLSIQHAVIARHGQRFRANYAADGTGAPVQPMLATAGPLPTGPGWAYEFKWDGVRALADVGAAGLHLSARCGNEITAAYPELAALAGRPRTCCWTARWCPYADGRPSSPRWRSGCTCATRRGPPAGRDRAGHVHGLRRAPARRRGPDRPAVRASGAPRWSGWRSAGRHWTVPPRLRRRAGHRAAAAENGLEGVVAKRLSLGVPAGHCDRRTGSRCGTAGRRSSWSAAGSRQGGRRRDRRAAARRARPGGRLVYAGRVGGGISAARCERDAEAAAAAGGARLAVRAMPLAARGRPRSTWVRPEVVVEVEYGERTPDGRLRFPSFRRLRPDKTPEEVDDA